MPRLCFALSAAAQTFTLQGPALIDNFILNHINHHHHLLYSNASPWPTTQATLPRRPKSAPASSAVSTKAMYVYYSLPLPRGYPPPLFPLRITDPVDPIDRK